MKRNGCLVTVSILLLCACRNPWADHDAGLTGGLAVTVAGSGIGERTVAPDFLSLVAAVEISLTSDDGYTAPSPIPHPPSASALPPGRPRSPEYGRVPGISPSAPETRKEPRSAREAH